VERDLDLLRGRIVGLLLLMVLLLLLLMVLLLRVYSCGGSAWR
jgi:hypothetical protein